MSTQSKKMPILELKMYVRVVAAVFSVSAATAFVMALLRVLHPELYYLEPLSDDVKFIHYFTTGLMLVTSAIGVLNSLSVVCRATTAGHQVTTWLLLDSLFETSRVVYVFLAEVALGGRGRLQLPELIISAVQYLVDSFLYCQMILRH